MSDQATEDLRALAQPLQRNGTSSLENLQDKIAAAVRTASESIDRARQPATRTMWTIALALHRKANALPANRRVATFLRDSANRIEDAAEYIRAHEVKQMAADAESCVRRNPGPSLIAAAALGLFVGAALRRGR